MTKPTLISSALWLTLFLMLGRVSGMFREITLARAYGVSSEADAAIILLTVPDILVAMLLAGGLGSALIPAMKKLDGKAQLVLFQKSLFAVLVCFSVLAVGLSFNTGFFLTLFAPGTTSAPVQGFDTALLLVGIAIPIAAASGVLVSFLNSRERFVLPATGTLLFNGCLCIYFLFLSSNNLGVVGVGLAVLTAVVVRFGWKALAIPEAFKPAGAGSDVRLGSIVSPFINAMGATIVVVGIPIFFRSVASFDGAGSIAIYNYTLKFYELAVLVLIAPLTTVLLPYLSKLFASGSDGYSGLLTVGFKVTLVATCLAVVAYYNVGQFFVDLLFSIANLPSENTQQIFDQGRYLFIAVPFFCLSQVLATSQYATGGSSNVLKASIAAAAITIVIYFLRLHDLLHFPVIFYVAIFNALYFCILFVRFDFRQDVINSYLDIGEASRFVASVVLLVVLFGLGRIVGSIPVNVVIVLTVAGFLVFVNRRHLNQLRNY